MNRQREGINDIPIFSPALLEEIGFHVAEKVETAKGIMIILAKRGRC